MLLPDVKVLVYAHRAESPEHERYAEWLRALATGLEPFALSELGASGFVRIATNRKIWDDPTSLEDALHFIEKPFERPTAHSRPSELADLRSLVHRRASARQARRRRISRSARDRARL